MDECVCATVDAVEEPIDADKTAAVPKTAACMDAAVTAGLLLLW